MIVLGPQRFSITENEARKWAWKNDDELAIVLLEIARREWSLTGNLEMVGVTERVKDGYVITVAGITQPIEEVVRRTGIADDETIYPTRDEELLIRTDYDSDKPLLPPRIAVALAEYLATHGTGKVELDCKDGRIVAMRPSYYVSAGS